MKRWWSAIGFPLVLVIFLQACFALSVAASIGARGKERFVVTLALFFFDAVGRRLVNDYEDAKRGVDNRENVRPGAPLQSGLKIRQVFIVGMLSFLVAWVCALYLVLTTNPWLLAPTVLCYVAYFLYAGGPKPLGHRYLGEAIDFLVSGFLVTFLAIAVNVQEVGLAVAIASLVPAFLFTALMLHNNARDVRKDLESGKFTLPHWLGLKPTQVLYTLLLLGAYLSVIALAVVGGNVGFAAPLVTMPWALWLIRSFWGAKRLGTELVDWSYLYIVMISFFSLAAIGGGIGVATN